MVAKPFTTSPEVQVTLERASSCVQVEPSFEPENVHAFGERLSHSFSFRVRSRSMLTFVGTLNL